MKWFDELKDDEEQGLRGLELKRLTRGEFARFIAIVELLKKIKEDGTGSVDGKRVWPLRAAHWREANKLLSDEWRKDE